MYNARTHTPPYESAGPWHYQSYKGVDGVAHEQGTGDQPGFWFAWRTAEADGYPPGDPL